MAVGALTPWSASTPAPHNDLDIDIVIRESEVSRMRSVLETLRAPEALQDA
jgi:hypothetical protein